VSKWSDKGAGAGSRGSPQSLGLLLDLARHWALPVLVAGSTRFSEVMSRGDNTEVISTALMGTRVDCALVTMLLTMGIGLLLGAPTVMVWCNGTALGAHRQKEGTYGSFGKAG
jgi:hypothetical protein